MVKPKFMLLFVVIGILMLFGLTYFFCDLLPKINQIIDDDNGPCPIADTVDLTGSKKNSDGSYLYEGLIIPTNLTRSYEYKPAEFLKLIPAKAHVRGCVCKLRPCVRFCCPKTKQMSEHSCIDLDGTKKSSNEINITSSSGEIRKGDVMEEFFIQYDRICPLMYYFEAQQYPEDASSLLKNGTLEFLESKKNMFKEEFCLSYLDEDLYILAPMGCAPNNVDDVDETRAHISAYTMLFSVPFFIATIIVYMVIPEKRTFHGKALCCYLSGLTFLYLILATIVLITPGYFSELPCNILGYSGYFWFLASFSWLSVISFDLYNNTGSLLRKGIHKNEKKLFVMRSIFAWGFALILLCLTYTADQSSLVSDAWKPTINVKNRCWFTAIEGWTTMIYLFSPMIILNAFNLVMFILTFLRIYGTLKETSQMMENTDNQKNLRTERDRFGIFLRLFIVMGVSWSVEIIPYLIGKTDSCTIEVLYYIFDFVNGIQGFVIFVLFVFRKKVKQQLTERFLPNTSLEVHYKTRPKPVITNSTLDTGDYSKTDVMDKFIKTQI